MLKRYKKGIALLFLITFVQEIISPTVSFALTGGPSQPEVQSFEPVGTNQMVDLSTGDFNYNIPLMVVPGPNGGYPINIAYHAGIGMEQEASWVGLGWNINPGAITRNLRGVPDDFSGDEIKKTVSLKKDVTVGIGVNLEMFNPAIYQETFGHHLVPSVGNLELYFNNYRGVGYNISRNRIAGFERKVGKKDNGGIYGILGLSYDSQTGLGLPTNIGIASSINKRDSDYSVGVGFHSRQGLQSISFGKDWNGRVSKRNHSKYERRVGQNWGTISFVNHTYVPAVNTSMKGTSINTSLTVANKIQYSAPIPVGVNHKIFKKNNQVRVSVNTSEVKSITRNIKSYGSLYLQNLITPQAKPKEYNQMMDMNVSNDVPISKNSVNMGFPFLTNDIYMISGQGIGGTFRAHRNDIGRMYKTGNQSRIDRINAGVELGIGNSASPLALIPHTDFLLHVGLDPGYGYSNSYSGQWSNGLLHLQNLNFRQENSTFPLYESFYFRLLGEQTAISNDEYDYQFGEKPVSFEMALYQGDDDSGPKPFAKSNIPNSSKRITSRAQNKERIKRAENIGFSTKNEVVKDDLYGNRPKHIFPENQMPDNTNGVSIDYANQGNDKHLQEFEILKPDGTMYTYGLPAYNNKQQEVMFSNSAYSSFEYTDAQTITYDPLDASVDNDEGYDEYYSETEIPAYIHANLITKITSADYVDLTGNGPTEDDFGFYTKFNYSKVSDYKWRAPYRDANYIKGYYSNTTDDKSSYTYGEKDLYYVNSIETKTHIAFFELGDRNDGLGVQEKNQTIASTGPIEKQKYIKTIKLYSKKDLVGGISQATPLQIVHFEYNYELCQNIPNNNGGVDDGAHIKSFDPNDPSAANEGGKLTLKKLFITYNGNEKGRLSPYEFEYGENFGYSKFNMDRWGNYQIGSQDDFSQSPYTSQQATDQTSNMAAAAWNLSEIKMPSGAILNVDYEMDDYGYVQDKRAMEMFEVYGLSEIEDDPDIDPELPTSNDRFRQSKKNKRLWFKLNNPLSGNNTEDLSIIADHVNGIEDMYFKVFEELKHQASNLGQGNKAKDYVVGYAKIDVGVGNYYGYDPGELNYAYVDLKEVTYQTSGFNVFKTHPFRKAGWQYIRHQRPDLFQNLSEADDLADNIGNGVVSIFTSFGNILSETISLLALGYYNKAALLGYCKEFSDQKKSFIRLNSPSFRKKGGGHRIKSIKLSDNWIEGAREFGTEYKYETEKGLTSGVADYEPLLGGEENCLKNPIYYNGNDQLLSFKHIDAYIETPIAEAVYPGPRIVYSRVLEKNIDEVNGEVVENQSGITVHEFFTAKDFPVYEKQSDLNHKGFNLPLPIPFVGLQSIQNNGYSQGYTVVLNNMSGKSKSVGAYKYTTSDDLGEPINKTEYIYKRSANKRLNNKVKVLDAHGIQRNAIIGVEQDLAINEEENSTVSMGIDSETNLDLWIRTLTGTPPIPLPQLKYSFNKSYNYSESMYRGISTSKVIYKTGVLDKVKVFSEGSSVTTENILFDAETGEPLLTKVTNEWNKPVYNYTYPAHWAYKGMKGAYKNYNAKLKIVGTQGALQLLNTSNSTILEPEEILTLGDEISILDDVSNTFKTYYVTEIDNTNDEFTLENADGMSVGFTSNVDGKIKRSGHRNLQSVKSGSVIALNQSFLGAGSSNLNGFSLFSTSFNNFITGADAPIVENSIHFSPPYLDNFKYNIPDLSGSNQNGEPRFSINDQLVENQFNINVINGNCIATYSLVFTPPSIGFSWANYLPKDIQATSTTFTNINYLANFEIISDIADVNGRILEFKHIPSGIVFNAILSYSEISCETETPTVYSGILHSDASTFSDDWGNEYPYSDLGDPTNGSVPISTSSLNEYRYGKKGIWRLDKNYLFQKERLQSNLNANPDTEFETKINVDGEYAFWKPFEWTQSATNPDWDWVSAITKYSPYGFVLEEKSRLSADPVSGNSIDVFTSQITGYDNSLVTAKSSNTSYYEFGFTGFEQDASYVSTGHIDLVTTGSLTIDATKSHTGKQSLALTTGQNIDFTVNNNTGTNQELFGVNAKEYIVSLWVNVEEAGSKLTLTAGGTSVDTDAYGEIIDGWKKIEMKFTMGQVNEVINMVSTGNTFIDDLRISPYNGGMVSYVYDRYNLWLLAELDALNYATFYNYDSEGNLIQVKKETEKGIVTLKTSRSNNKQTP